MKCKDCKNFKTSPDIEAAAEFSPNSRMLKGKCGINDKSCKAMDNCNCDGFAGR